MNEKILFVCLIFCCLGLVCGCRSTQSAGDESLVESRIITAVNAERNRWAAELGQQIRDGLRETDERINAVEGGLQQVAVAAREYRQFVLKVINELQPAESPEPPPAAGVIYRDNPFLP